MDGFYIYKYVTSSGQIVYIGKSENVLQRVKQHTEEKFKKYPDAEIYVHKCASRHEMDALEVILIEKHKPELNEASKTDNELSFTFSDDLEWVSIKDIIPVNKEKRPKGKKPDEIIIKSDITANKFQEAVMKWHDLYYFINWLQDQRPDDERGTIFFNLSDAKEACKWVWNFDNYDDCNNLDKSYGVAMPVIYGMALVTSASRRKDKIWINLHYPVNVLKKIVPSLIHDLKRREGKIKEFSGIGEKYINQSKENGFYDYFMTVRFNTDFPTVTTDVNQYVCNETMKAIRDDVIRPAKHTSPDIDFSKITTEDVLSMFRSKTYYTRPGGAYWNIWGFDKIIQNGE